VGVRKSLDRALAGKPDLPLLDGAEVHPEDLRDVCRCHRGGHQEHRLRSQHHSLLRGRRTESGLELPPLLAR